jgi:two-component system sensor histidine kinase KdpD
VNLNMRAQERADDFLRLIRRSRRGRLKIYLGYGAGVGKTYQMLREGHRLKGEGIDVVAGFIETHGREETKVLSEGLEIVPRRRQEYRGHVLEEMDVDAILVRRPEVALIDELAHTNVPGSRNSKRYQDVQDILAAGIHVITTLNVQHLESLYDTVEKTVHVKVRERIPDTVVAEADEIVNVDLTTEDLQERLREGKIYPSERIETALANFFKASNLEKLRELTLRELAAQIDLRRRESSEEEAATPDQVMVCLSSGGPNSNMLLRYASRLAGRLNRNWYAVYVQTPSEAPTIIDAATQRVLAGTLTLAKQLGAMVFTYKGEDVADTIVRFAREYRVGHIVMGSPSEIPWWKRLLGRKSILERLIHSTEGINIVVVDTAGQEAPEEPATPVEPELEREETAPKASRPVPRPALTLSRLMCSDRIVIWDHPVPKELVLRTLVEIACGDLEKCNSVEIADSVFKREEQASTFFNEGVAFPHARVEGIDSPTVSMGLTRQGVSDVSTANPIELVFLILAPAETPAVQVQVLSLVSKAGRDRGLVRSLIEADEAAEALDIIRNWETAG